MDPSGNSQLFQNLGSQLPSVPVQPAASTQGSLLANTSAHLGQVTSLPLLTELLKTTDSCCHQQRELMYMTTGNSDLQGMPCATQPDNVYSTKSTSPDVTSTISPMVSEDLRPLPASTQTTVHSCLDNASSNAAALGFPNVTLVEGPSSVSSFSNMSDLLARNSLMQIHDTFQSANLFPQVGSQLPSFPMLPAAPTQGLPLTYPPAQLAQMMSTPLFTALLQQMLCSSLNTMATPLAFLPTNITNLVTQLIAQLLTTQLAQSAQAGPQAVLLQLIQAVSSMEGSAPAAPCLQAVAQTSILSQLPSLDPAMAKQMIVILVNQLVLSGNLTEDDVCRRFVEKLQSSPSSSPWQQTHTAANSTLRANQNVCALHSLNPQNVPITPENIKKEIISSDSRDHSDGFRVSVSSNAFSLHRSACDGAGIPVSEASMPSDFTIRVGAASQQCDIEMSSGSDGESIVCKTEPRVKANVSPGNSRNTAKRTRKFSSEQLSKISIKGENDTTDIPLKIVGKGKSKNNFKETDITDISKRIEPSEEFQKSCLRLRNRSKTVKYCEEKLSDGLEHSDDDTDVRRKKKNSQSSCHNSVVKGSETITSFSLNASSSSSADVASCRSATNSQAVVKNEITDPISVLPMVNICHSPNLRYLFMGRKYDGMDWLNLVSYKTNELDESVNQCLFCPMISSEVKPVADHIASEHGDLDFVLKNIKQPNGRVTYLVCRHCNFLTFEPTLMWIHFELYHGIPGIMDGSSLPPVKISDPVKIEEISLDKPVNSGGCQPAYVCLDCMLCSSNSKNVATHVLGAHSDTVNFNGCFVKLMMIKGREKDSFTFREALYDESHADALKDVYVCMLCQYSTYGAYLAMSHNLRLHQTKRLLFICNECEYQCTLEPNLMMHMASVHQCSSISSFMCSVTLVTTLSDGTFIECKIPAKQQKISDFENSRSDCEMKSNSIIQSTAVSSSQEKQKSCLPTGHEDSTSTPQNNQELVSLLSRKVSPSTKKKKNKKKMVLTGSAVMPNLKLEMKTRNENFNTSTDAPEKAPKLKPIRYS